VVGFFETEPASKCRTNDAGGERRPDASVLVIIEIAAAGCPGAQPFAFGVGAVKVEKDLAAHEAQIHGAAPGNDRTDLEIAGCAFECIGGVAYVTPARAQLALWDEELGRGLVAEPLNATVAGKEPFKPGDAFPCRPQPHVRELVGQGEDLRRFRVRAV